MKIRHPALDAGSRIYDELRKPCPQARLHTQAGQGKPITSSTLSQLEKERSPQSTNKNPPNSDDAPPPAATGDGFVANPTPDENGSPSNNGEAFIAGLASGAGAPLAAGDIGAVFGALADVVGNSLPQPVTTAADGPGGLFTVFRSETLPIEQSATRIASPEAGGGMSSTASARPPSMAGSVFGGVLFGAALGSADVAMQVGGVPETKRETYLAETGILFALHVASKAPLDAVAMIPGAVPGAFVGGGAGYWFDGTPMARDIETLMGIDLTPEQWATLGATTGGGASAGATLYFAGKSTAYAVASRAAVTRVAARIATRAFPVIGLLIFAQEFELQPQVVHKSSIYRETAEKAANRTSDFIEFPLP